MDGRTDRPTDRGTDRPSYRDAWTHLKIVLGHVLMLEMFVSLEIILFELKH